MPAPAVAVLEALLKAAELARIGMAVSVVEPDGITTCVQATSTAAQLLGTPLEKLIGGALKDFLGLAHELSDQVQKGSARRADGTQVELELSSSLGTLDGRPAIITFLLDAKEQREARETARRLAQLIEQTPDAVVISRRGSILEANPAAARMLGVPSAAHLVGQSLARFVVPEDGAMMRERMASVARGENPGAPRVYRAVRPDGSVVLVEIASFASEHGGQPAIIAFGRDVTDREKLQEQLARTERLAALGTLAAGVAHEINNPLATVALNAEVLQRALSRGEFSGPDRESGAAALAELRNSIERMTAIVRDLTGFSRASTEQFGAVNVIAVIERALRVASHATKHRAAVRVELGTIPPAFGHAGKLEQVLVNLIVNAAQALSPDREAQNEILVRAFAPDPRHVAIEITDNGAGIPPGLVNRVFDPFFTTKPDGEGTGLGLFISHNHVRQMEGELVLESVPGRTTMRVVLRAAEARDPQLVPEYTAPRVRARGRVLIVDDEPTMCRSLQILLRDDYDTTVALGGAEALELIERGDSFDLILCDLMMPGVTGMDLFSQLEQKRPGLEKRMIFMTGGAFTDEARAFLSRCPNLRLQKPFAAEALETALQQVLQLSAREPSR